MSEGAEAERPSTHALANSNRLTDAELSRWDELPDGIALTREEVSELIISIRRLQDGVLVFMNFVGGLDAPTDSYLMERTVASMSALNEFTRLLLRRHGLIADG